MTTKNAKKNLQEKKKAMKPCKASSLCASDGKTDVRSMEAAASASMNSKGTRTNSAKEHVQTHGTRGVVFEAGNKIMLEGLYTNRRFDSGQQDHTGGRAHTHAHTNTHSYLQKNRGSYSLFLQ